MTKAVLSLNKYLLGIYRVLDRLSGGCVYQSGLWGLLPHLRDVWQRKKQAPDRSASVWVRRAALNRVAATFTSEEMSRELRGRRERSHRTREQKSGNHRCGSIWTGGNCDRASGNEEHVTLGKTGKGWGKAWGQRPKELVNYGALATVTSSVAGLGERREK